jgi:hypothetical protein
MDNTDRVAFELTMDHLIEITSLACLRRTCKTLKNAIDTKYIVYFNQVNITKESLGFIALKQSLVSRIGPYVREFSFFFDDTETFGYIYRNIDYIISEKSLFGGVRHGRSIIRNADGCIIHWDIFYYGSNCWFIDNPGDKRRRACMSVVRNKKLVTQLYGSDSIYLNDTVPYPMDIMITRTEQSTDDSFTTTLTRCKKRKFADA